MFTPERVIFMLEKGDYMLLQLCRECKNFFIVSFEFGEFEIESGILSGLKNSVQAGLYLLIERAGMGAGGSLLNGGLFAVDGEFPRLKGAVDEAWKGNVYFCAIPHDFVALAKEIEENIAGTPQGNFTHEAFGAYSYSRAVNARGVLAAWNEVYAERLAHYRNKMFLEVRA